MQLKNDRKPSIYYGYVVVLAGFIVLVTFWGATYSFGVFLKPLSTEFGWTRALTAGSQSMFLFVQGLLCMVSGRLTDRFGPRIVVTGCGFIFGLGYLLMSQITNLWQLYLIYGVMLAVGMSGSTVPMSTTVTRWFVKRRGLMTGIVLSAIGAGAMVGPPVSGWLISSYGWRQSYFTIGILSLILLIMVGQFLRRDPAKLGQLPYGETEITGEGLVLENRGFSYQEAVHTRQFWMVFFTNMFWGIIINSIAVHIVPHATDMGISALRAANILTAIGAVHVAARLAVSSLVDRIGSKRGITIGLTMLLIALLSLQLARELWVFYLFAIMFGIAHGSIGLSIPLTVAGLFGTRTQGAILGTIVFAWAIGGLIGPFITGYIFDVTYSYNLAFWGLALSSIIGLTLISLLKPLARKV